jgi:hypothetical protein
LQQGGLIGLMAGRRQSLDGRIEVNGLADCWLLGMRKRYESSAHRDGGE